MSSAIEYIKKQLKLDDFKVNTEEASKKLGATEHILYGSENSGYAGVVTTGSYAVTIRSELKMLKRWDEMINKYEEMEPDALQTEKKVYDINLK